MVAFTRRWTTMYPPKIKPVSEWRRRSRKFRMLTVGATRWRDDGVAVDKAKFLSQSVETPDYREAVRPGQCSGGFHWECRLSGSSPEAPSPAWWRALIIAIRLRMRPLWSYIAFHGHRQD